MNVCLDCVMSESVDHIVECVRCNAPVANLEFIYPDGSVQCAPCEAKFQSAICPEHKWPLADCKTDKLVHAPVFCGAGHEGCEVDHV